MNTIHCKVFPFRLTTDWGTQLQKRRDIWQQLHNAELKFEHVKEENHLIRKSKS